MVLAHVRAGGLEGIGYSYISGAAATLIRETLGPAIIGCDAYATPAAAIRMMRVIRNHGQRGIGACAVSLAAQTVYPTGTTIYDPARAWSGFTVLSPLQTQAVIVIDMNGNVVKQWDGFVNSAGGPARVFPGGRAAADRQFPGAVRHRP